VVVKQELGQRGLGVQGIGGHHAAAQGHVGQQLLEHGNLVGFVVHAHRHEGFVGIVRGNGEQVGRRLGFRPRAAHGLAVPRQRRAVALRARLLHPAGQGPLHVGHRQTRQQPAIERAGGAQMPSGATHACAHRPMVPRPAPDRLQRVAVAEQRGDQAEQQER